jgi:hypothetical protein
MITFLWPVSIFTALSILFCYPLFLNLKNWGIHDWDIHFSLMEVIRETILRYHQLPLWNPYASGGHPLLGYPIASVLSPTTILVLLFGPVLGAKFNIVLHLIIGLLGMFFLARYLGMERISSYFSSFVFMFSSWYALHSSMGHYNFLNTTYIPFAVLFYLKALTDWRFSVLSGLTMAMMVFESGLQIAMMTGFLLLFFALYRILVEQRFDGLIAVTLIGVFVVLMSAVCVFPLWFDILSQRPRMGIAVASVPFKAIFSWFLDRNQYNATPHLHSTVPISKKWRGSLLCLAHPEAATSE